MKQNHALLLCLLTFLWLQNACTVAKKAQNSTDIVQFNILQINDVYEIASIENGKAGGMARVATIRKDLLKENSNTLTVMAGDFLNPSLIGTLKYEGKGIKGRQMVEVMNAVGVDLVCFGNHEFDLDSADLQSRMNESKFEWVSSNVFQRNKSPFLQNGVSIKSNFSKNIYNKQNDKTINIGIFGLCVDANKKDYVFYDDIFAATDRESKNLAKSEILLGLTHLTIDQDKQIATAFPNISLIMGGHEHNNMEVQQGTVKITKADANAKTVFVHRFTYDTKARKVVNLKSELVKIDDTVPTDSTVNVVVQKWQAIAAESFKKQGFDPAEVIADISEMLDGREATNRFQPTNLGQTIAQSIAYATKEPSDCAFFNSGSIRLDDQITGKITQADIVRCMPYGGKIFEMDILGSELQKVLFVGLLNKGRGGYLQSWNVEYVDAEKKEDKTFKINGKILDKTKYYHIATSEFLFSGKEANLDFFTEKNPNIKNIKTAAIDDVNDLRSDIRKAFIAFLKKK